jgi:hypothetical protein
MFYSINEMRSKHFFARQDQRESIARGRYYTIYSAAADTTRLVFCKTAFLIVSKNIIDPAIKINLLLPVQAKNLMND